jgi:hypothetical protein
MLPTCQNLKIRCAILVYTKRNSLLTRSCMQQVQALPKATLLLATAKVPNRQDLLRYLAIWAPGNAAQGLQLLCGPAAEEPAVRSYAIKCLFNERPEKVSWLQQREYQWSKSSSMLSLSGPRVACTAVQNALTPACHRCCCCCGICSVCAAGGLPASAGAAAVAA